MEQRYANSGACDDFAAFAKRESSLPSGQIQDALPNSSALARFITGLVAHSDGDLVQRAFDHLESLLRKGTPETRDWVCSVLETIQDIGAWGPSSSDSFWRFLGPETRRSWSVLDTIRRDLEDCSALEAEVLMWRVVHHDPLAMTARSPA
jgi:hypothetical protein